MEDPIDMPHKLGVYPVDHFNKSGNSVGLEAYPRYAGYRVPRLEGHSFSPIGSRKSRSHKVTTTGELYFMI